MELDLTIAIPTFNGAQRLPLVLEKLRSQVNVEAIAWEIVVVDNNSCDETAALVQQYQATWDLPVPLRYCFEANQGIAFARQRAIEEAKGALVGFLDDDNIPAVDWVAAACAFAQSHPQVGAFSGQIHGDFEVVPPAEFGKIQAFLAIRQHGSQPWRFSPEKLQLPPGAGLVVRRAAWLACVPTRTALAGRVGQQMLAGDDYEALLYLHKAGWEIWYTPTMQMHHRIPRQRLERDYLLKLARGTGLSTCQLCLVTASSWQKPIVMMRTLLGNARRLVLHIYRYRGQFRHNLIAAFELEFFLGGLLSPLYVLRNNFFLK